MSDPVLTPASISPVERRVDAIQAVLHARGMKPAEFIETAEHLVEEQWLPANGARIVARAWTDPAFRDRLLAPLASSAARSHNRIVVFRQITAGP